MSCTIQHNMWTTFAVDLNDNAMSVLDSLPPKCETRCEEEEKNLDVGLYPSLS